MPASGIADLLDQKVQLEQDNEALINQLKYYHGILSILLELEGGVVEITAEVLENYDLSGTINIMKSDETNTYTVELASE